MEQAILNYVNVLNFSVSKTWLKKMIASHSDYPSLLSVSDTLERLRLQHQILRIAPEDLEHFSTPYLLHRSLPEKCVSHWIKKISLRRFGGVQTNQNPER